MPGRKRARRERRAIRLKNKEDIASMRRAGRIVALVLERLGKAAVPGITTGELDRLAAELIASFGAEATFFGLYGYPAHVCISVNDEVVHGIPGERVLREGDIVSFDVGATVEGRIADGAATFGVGEVGAEAERLMRATREALEKGIAQAKPGNRVKDIAAAVQRHVEAAGYGVVRQLVGHGVGHEAHEPPQVPNFVGGEEENVELVPGMGLAIEPMVTQGGYEVVQEADGWTYRTRDGSLSAHFEHTIVITDDGCEVLTVREGPGGAPRPGSSGS